METIDLTMTWEGALPLILAVLTDGNAEGRKFAREELTRMAQVADRATSDTNRVSQNPGGYAHCTKHDESYDTEHWSCCEKCWEKIIDELQRMTKDA